MWEHVAKRLIQAPIILLIVSATIFAITRATPGDPIQIMLGSQTSPDAVAALRAQFRLDEPVYMQYFYWLGDLFRGDFGKSIRLNVPVLDLLAERLPISLALASGALALAFLVSIPLGILAALKRNTWIDYLATGYTLLGFAIPNFALAIVLIYVFAIQLGWFPITGIGSGASADGSVWAMIQPFVLPAIALGTLQTAVFTRLLRSSMIDVLSQDYIRTAHAKGLQPITVLVVHALKNAMIPFVTMAAIQFAYLIGAQVTIEYTFAIPGIGSAILAAVVNRDFPIVQGFVLIIAIFFLLANIVADILYSVIDPRIRY